MRAKFWLITLAVSAVLVVGGTAAGLYLWYNNSLKPVSSSEETVFFTVSSGSGVHKIGADLHSAGLIRSTNAFQTYLTTNNYRDKLQAGTYRLSPSMSIQTIVDKMVNGDVARDLLTILPGKRLDEIQKTFRDAGYSQAEVNTAFNPGRYSGHPALASLPSGADLEGYLYPDSFEKQSGTHATTIIRQSLDEMAKYLTQDVTNGFKAKGLSTHEGIILASIVLKETDSPADQPMVAQVLLTRLAHDMALQADATAIYGAVKDGVNLSGLSGGGAATAIAHDSAYNTYLHPGLPPGPISNATKGALNAAAKPASTDFVYYFTGEDCKMHYTRTLQEHEAAIQRYGVKSCSEQ